MYLPLAGLLLPRNRKPQLKDILSFTASAGNGSSIPRASMAMNLRFYMWFLLDYVQMPLATDLALIC